MTDNDDTLDVSVHSALRKIAITTRIGELAVIVLRMRASGAGGRSAVNSTIMVAIVAERREPAEIAELVAEFDGQSIAGDLARLALDAAAARRSAQTLALLARDLVEYGLARRADELLALVVRRRLPRDIAELFTVLDVAGLTPLTSTLIREIARDDGRVFVMLWLRAFNRADLATRAAQLMTTMLAPPELAGFIKGLRAFQDTDAADAAVHAALRLDISVVAQVAENLRGGAGPRPGASEEATGGPVRDAYATEFLNEALATLSLADLCVLAGRLGAGTWQDGAQLIWDKVVKGVNGPDLVQTLWESATAAGNPGAALDGIGKAALVYSIKDVAALAVEVEGKITVVNDQRRSGYDTVLDTVAEHRPVPDIFAMADEVTDLGYGRVADDLLSRVENILHERADGAEIAEFIDRMLARPDKPQPRGPFRRPQGWEPARILHNVAKTRNPAQLMGVIAGLMHRRRYDACRKWIEEYVPDCYDGRLFAELPLVRRRDQLPAVLQILARASRTPRWTSPNDIAAIAAALRKAGASDTDLRYLLAYTGGRRDNDFDAIVTALRNAGLAEEAEWVLNGHRRPSGEPRFLG